MKAAKVDSSRLLQQTICYHRHNNWSFSISWGYSVHIYETIYPRNVLVKPLQTFLSWQENDRPPLFMFDTRDVKNNSCETPHVFFFHSLNNSAGNQVVTTYIRASPRDLPPCMILDNHSADSIYKIQVFSPATRSKEVSYLYQCFYYISHFSGFFRNGLFFFFQEGKIECCDVEEMNEMDVAEIKLRACREDESI